MGRPLRRAAFFLSEMGHQQFVHPAAPTVQAMKTMILLAGATMLAFTSPADAKPGNGNGHGKNQASGYEKHGQGSRYGYGVGGCPPGLAKKSPACVPPGQAKKLFNVGQRVPNGYQGYTPYSQVPYDLRRQYGLGYDDRYIYRDNYLYRVDPKTMVVEQILNAVRR